MRKLDFKYNDGGRSKYFKADKVGDCVTRAIAIILSKDYKGVYNMIHALIGYSPRNGVQKKDTKKIMQLFGGQWVSTARFGQSMKMHLNASEMPLKGRYVCQVSKHITAIIDGVINDTYDPSRDGTRMVYGYWLFK